MATRTEKIEWLKKMMALAEKEADDCSYGEMEVRMGARVGCDCGCGGDNLTPEDFEYERDEKQYEELLNLAEEKNNNIKELFEKSDLPDIPDREHLDNKLFSVRSQLEEYFKKD
jgi:hypothetical protein